MSKKITKEDVMYIRFNEVAVMVTYLLSAFVFNAFAIFCESADVSVFGLNKFWLLFGTVFLDGLMLICFFIMIKLFTYFNSYLDKELKGE